MNHVPIEQGEKGGIGARDILESCRLPEVPAAQQHESRENRNHGGHVLTNRPHTLAQGGKGNVVAWEVLEVLADVQPGQEAAPPDKAEASGNIGGCSHATKGRKHLQQMTPKADCPPPAEKCGLVPPGQRSQVAGVLSSGQDSVPGLPKLSHDHVATVGLPHYQGGRDHGHADDHAVAGRSPDHVPHLIASSESPNCVVQSPKKLASIPSIKVHG
mmetsp:Transcript_13617/g.30027  ORF Transcript_13617/g.30027 Transcript_13617/m.30027 type:complete len:215 (+) Transcript_13617:674-1318(+)